MWPFTTEWMQCRTVSVVGCRGAATAKLFLRMTHNACRLMLMMMGFRFVAWVAVIVSTVLCVVIVAVVKRFLLPEKGMGMFVAVGVRVDVPVDQVPMHVLMAVPVGVFVKVLVPFLPGYLGKIHSQSSPS
jgi:hypothetical protein